MTPVAVGVLAVSMSVDAFVASVGKGAGAQRVKFGTALRTGLIFGVVEMITPLIGWALGIAASQYIDAVDHWVAFALLAAVGAHMMWQALQHQPDAPRGDTTLWATVLTAIGTSIDAMAIGVSLAFLEVNILLIALAIGTATMLMSTGGMLAGRLLGQRFGRVAEALGGIALIGLGSLILFEHLTAAAG
ncbi:manganese efflux pump MntP family protein [Ketogulonicigenium vulgare]|uniref:manganese efflux pump MntP n=1 Tax=Ketogulonicigenium vulgare TaxID=92945 RepID=UPI0023590153|nr:manganese efflux pump MntP family protein [Ketogulonicigenium vulgare]